MKYTPEYSELEYIFDMKDRDHIAINSSNSEQMNEIVINFNLLGIMRNKINFWIVNQNEKEDWLEILRKKGIDVDHLIASQDLIIMEHKEIFTGNSQISLPFLKKFQELKNLTSIKKKSGINVMGTLVGHLFAEGKFSDCFCIEKERHEVIETFEIPITAVCLYHSLMTEKHQADIIAVHKNGLLLAKNSQIIKKMLQDIKDNDEKIDKYHSLESAIFPKNELTILNSLNEIISIMREKENFEKNQTIEKRNKDIPEWYFNLIESLNKLYGNGYTDANKEMEELR